MFRVRLFYVFYISLLRFFETNLIIMLFRTNRKHCVCLYIQIYFLMLIFIAGCDNIVLEDNPCS